MPTSENKNTKSKKMDSIGRRSPLDAERVPTPSDAEKMYQSMDEGVMDARSIPVADAEETISAQEPTPSDFAHSAMPVASRTPAAGTTSNLDLLGNAAPKNSSRAGGIFQNIKHGFGSGLSNVGRGARALSWKQWALIVAGLCIAGAVSAGGYVYYVTTHSITDKANQTGFFGQIQRIVDKNVEPLRGEKEDRINVLLMGKGGDGHDGGGLVDTIMVASIQPSTDSVALISFPRDLVVPFTPKGQKYPDYRKINNVVVLGGVDFAKETVHNLTGLDIQYYANVDFGGFKNIVDTLGGVDIAVPRGFTGLYGAQELSTPCPKAKLDYTIGDGAYCKITFTAGDEHMNGERALQYSRIRHIAAGSENGDEGSDFKRAARQQLILQAMKEKGTSASTLLNPLKLAGLLNDLGNHVDTDMEVWEMIRFAELVKNVDHSKIKNVVIDQGEGGLVHRDATVAAYVLVPNAGLNNYSEIQNIALNVFNESTIASDTTKQLLAAEQAVVIVQNGSTTEGLASRTAATLTNAGISVASYSNAAKKDLSTTIIFDFTGTSGASGGNKSATKAALEKQFGVTATPASLTQANTNVTIGGSANTSSIAHTEIPANTDFIVVLGSDVTAAKTTTSTNTNTPAATPATKTNTNTTQSSTNTNSAGSVRIIPTNTK